MANKLILIFCALAIGFTAGGFAFYHRGNGAAPDIDPEPVRAIPATVSPSDSRNATSSQSAETNTATLPPEKPEPELGPDGKPTIAYRRKYSAYLYKTGGPHLYSEKDPESAQVELYQEQLRLERMEPPDNNLVRTKGKQAYIDETLETTRDSMIQSGAPMDRLSPELCKAAALNYMRRKLEAQTTAIGRQMARDEAIKLGFPELAAQRSAEERKDLDTLLQSLPSATDAQPLLGQLQAFAPFSDDERARLEAAASNAAARMDVRGSILIVLARDEKASPAVYKNYLASAGNEQALDLINHAAPESSQVCAEMLNWISQHVSLESIKALENLSLHPQMQVTARAIYTDSKRPVEIRASAINAVNAALTPETSAALLQLWSNRDEDPRVRIAALGREVPSHRDKLHALILDKTENISVRAAALAAVGNFSFKHTDISDLQKAADDAPEIHKVWQKVSLRIDKLDTFRK